MKKLSQLLKEFDGRGLSEDELSEKFRELAKHFLFGGYINVRNQYHIYIKTVEFYYHEEDGDIKDPIMYHRNNNFIEGDIPYFPLLYFNSHDTGVDITFENEEKKIRASVLIRAYEVLRLDKNGGTRLVWNPKAEQFKKCENGDKKYNTQCLYLKRILNGFASEGTPDIMWIDDDTFNPEEIKEEDINIKLRQGVFESSNKKRYRAIKGTPDTRKWAFRRERDIDLK